MHVSIENSHGNRKNMQSPHRKTQDLLSVDSVNRRNQDSWQKRSQCHAALPPSCTGKFNAMLKAQSDNDWIISEYWRVFLWYLFFFIVFVVHLIKEKNWSMNWMFGPKVEVYRVNLDNCYTPVCEVGHINWSTTRYYLPWDKVQYVMVCNCIWRPHKHWGQ